MKTTIIIMVVILSASTYWFVKQPQPKQHTTEIVLLRDITGTSLVKVDANEISGVFDLSNNPWNGAIFNFENITDVSLNPGNGARISAQNEWLSNEMERTKEIKSFSNKVSEIIVNSSKDIIGKRNSSIYIPIIMKLNELSQSKSEKRILIIYSDLMENTKDISFYSKKTMKVLKTNPDLIAKQFEAMQSINNLQGIEVFIVFQPVNTASDSDFKTVSQFYKKLLEEKGGTVNISANLNL